MARENGVIFGVVQLGAASDRIVALQPIRTYFFTSKNTQNQGKKGVMSLYKHAKATNGSLNEVVAGVRRPFMTIGYKVSSDLYELRM